MKLRRAATALCILGCAAIVTSQRPPVDDDDFDFEGSGTGQDPAQKSEVSGVTAAPPATTAVSSGRWDADRRNSWDSGRNSWDSGRSSWDAGTRWNSNSNVDSSRPSSSFDWDSSASNGNREVFAEASGSGFHSDDEDDEYGLEDEDYVYEDEFDDYYDSKGDYEEDTKDIDVTKSSREEAIHPVDVHQVHGEPPPPEPAPTTRPPPTRRPPPPPAPTEAPVLRTHHEDVPSAPHPQPQPQPPRQPQPAPGEDLDDERSNDISLEDDEEKNVIVDGTQDEDRRTHHGLGTKPVHRGTSFFSQPGILAAVVGGAVVGLLCAILLVMLIVYRMRKKDEGSYPLDEPKRSLTGNTYSKNYNKEFYA